MPITKSVPKIRQSIHARAMTAAQQKKAIAAWRGIFGIWADKKLEDPVKWQRRMRQERKLPR